MSIARKSKASIIIVFLFWSGYTMLFFVLFKSGLFLDRVMYEWEQALIFREICTTNLTLQDLVTI